MAAGEYVSVSSQADTEHADLDRERRELAADPDVELDELAAIYESRGLDAPLARQVAEKLTAHDALSTHARDELGISQTVTARPVQAAFVSAGTFAVGAAMPVLTVLLATDRSRIAVVALMSLVFLALLGSVGAHAGGASVRTGAIRVTFWGAMAMAITAAIGALFGTIV